MKKCYQCFKECLEVYQVKMIDEVGKESIENVCSKECGLEVKEELYYLHKKRAETVYNQEIKKVK